MDIAAQERDLLIAFAKYTADINPGLLEKINAGHQKLSNGFRKHIELFVGLSNEYNRVTRKDGDYFLATNKVSDE